MGICYLLTNLNNAILTKFESASRRQGPLLQYFSFEIANDSFNRVDDLELYKGVCGVQFGAFLTLPMLDLVVLMVSG